MRVRAIDTYHGNMSIGDTFTVLPQFEKWFGKSYTYGDEGAPIIYALKEGGSNKEFHAFIWRFEVIIEQPYSPERSGDTDEDI